MPDALLRGTLGATTGGATRLGAARRCPTAGSCSACSSRRARRAAVRGWVLEADRGARGRRSTSWPRRRAGGRTPVATAVPPAELTGTAGGVADLGRRPTTRCQPLRLPRPARRPGRRSRPTASTATRPPTSSPGWWSTAALDPLDARADQPSLHDRLDAPGLGAGRRPEGGDQAARGALGQGELRASLGLETSARYSHRADAAAQRGAAAAAEHVARRQGQRSSTPTCPSSADEAIARPAPPTPALAARRRCCTAAVLRRAARAPSRSADNRPATARLGVALGEHGDDLAAALASAGSRRRTRPSGARSSGCWRRSPASCCDRVGTPDGLVDVEEHEHAAGFVLAPAGAGGTDRLQSRPPARRATAAGRPARGRSRARGLGRRRSETRSAAGARQAQCPARARAS